MSIAAHFHSNAARSGPDKSNRFPLGPFLAQPRHGLWLSSPSLGLRPLRKVLRITKFAAGSPAVEAPVDLGPGAIHPPGPGAGFAPQGGEVRESSAAEALACEEPDFDFRLVEP